MCSDPRTDTRPTAEDVLRVVSAWVATLDLPAPAAALCVRLVDGTTVQLAFPVPVVTLPTQAPVGKLRAKEKALLSAADATPVFRKQLIAAAGLRDNPDSRSAVASLLRRGLLEEVGKRVRRAISGHTGGRANV